MKNKLTYQVPDITVVEFQLEIGYAASNLVFAQEKIQTFMDQQLAEVGNTTRDGEVATGYFINEDQTDATVSSGWAYQDGGWF
jgi:hypothetical protein